MGVFLVFRKSESIEKAKGTPLHVISELLQDSLGTSDTSLGEQ